MSMKFLANPVVREWRIALLPAFHMFAYSRHFIFDLMSSQPTAKPPELNCSQLSWKLASPAASHMRLDSAELHRADDASCARATPDS